MSGILTAPFATAYPPLLQAALHAIETIILVDWPRIAYHRGEILRGLTVCWCKVDEEKSQAADLEEVQVKIRHCVNLLTVVLKRDVAVELDYKTLIESDNRLERLLVI